MTLRELAAHRTQRVERDRIDAHKRRAQHRGTLQFGADHFAPT
jgi:hypothetical protein